MTIKTALKGVGVAVLAVLAKFAKSVLVTAASVAAAFCIAALVAWLLPSLILPVGWFVAGQIGGSIALAVRVVKEML